MPRMTRCAGWNVWRLIVTDHKNIHMALAAAQASMGKAIKDTKNDHFRSKYADLASVMDACLSALNTNGIAVIQPTGTDERGDYVETILVHGASDTSVSCKVPLIIGKRDMQGYGSAVTYARRYGLMSMAGIAPEDDDGNAAAQNPPKDVPVVAAMSGGIADARENAVLDGLPENASPRQKAEAFASQIISEFQGKGAKALSNAWDRWTKHIEQLGAKHPDLHERVVDAYVMRENELTEEKGIAAQ